VTRGSTSVAIAIGVHPGGATISAWKTVEGVNEVVASTQGYFEAAARADPENVQAQRYLHATISRIRAASQPRTEPEKRGRLRRLFGRG